ncbi:hypothetical protein Igag_1966 [Ignisphaera aggregans DSM 17230]|uniref:Uncharacterized protein n=1 Tax=Ignisphaera aggregans (strain DSM 17230 / JCM 13409 / AQ1.S1) TaxID=583356 RepID=E0STH2_IGNAA|nr:hypothetical protein Igag_1966 [Ignisphaera aggregans DSM 17230]
MSRSISFKANPIKAKDRYYVYIPKAWANEIEEAKKRGKKLIVTIEFE